MKEEPEESDAEAEEQPNYDPVPVHDETAEEEEPEQDPEPTQEQPQPDQFKRSRFGRIIKPPERLNLMRVFADQLCLEIREKHLFSQSFSRRRKM